MGVTRSLGRGHQPVAEAYGEALGITAARHRAEAPPAIRESLLAFTGALRIYLLRVAALADADDPASQKLVHASFEGVGVLASDQWVAFLLGRPLNACGQPGPEATSSPSVCGRSVHRAGRLTGYGFTDITVALCSWLVSRSACHA